MERVLVGVFDSRQQMEAACRELAACAIPEERIHIRAVDEKLRSDVLGDRGDEHGTGFFQRLFHGVADRDEHAGQYAEAVRRGGCVVVVDGIDESRVDEAVKVMERHGAFDIDERAASWRERGWTGHDRAAPRLSPAEIDAERRYSQPRAATASRQMAAQNVASASQQTVQVGTREAQRGSVRVYPRTGEPPPEGRNSTNRARES